MEVEDIQVAYLDNEYEEYRFIEDVEVVEVEQAWDKYTQGFTDDTYVEVGTHLKHQQDPRYSQGIKTDAQPKTIRIISLS